MNDKLNKKVWSLIREIDKNFKARETPTRGFKGMIDTRDGDTLSAIEALFVNDREQSGFRKLFEEELLEMSLEAFVLHSEFSDLFSEQAKHRAKARLGAFDPKKSWATPA